MSHADQIGAVQRLVRESVAAVDALAPEALRAVLPALRAVRDELQGDLSEWLQKAPAGDTRFSALAKMQALRSLESTFARIAELNPAMERALTIGRKASGPLAIANLDTEIARMSAIFGHGVPTIPDIKTAAVIARGDKLLWKRHEASARRYAGNVGDDIKQLLAQGVAKHDTVDQIVRRLRQLGGGQRKPGPIDPGQDAHVIAGGMFQRHKFWADRLVKTELMFAYNVQHDVATEQLNAGRLDGEPAYQRKWDASADMRVCPICKGLDGQIAPIGGAFRGGYSPPAHPMCRCVVLAWLPRWSKAPGEYEPPVERKEIEARKPEPAPERAPPRDANAELASKVTDAVKRGHFSDARAHLEDRFVDMGLRRQEVFGQATSEVDVSNAGLELVTHSGHKITAGAFREWNGRIQLSEKSARDIAAFAEHGPLGRERARALLAEIDALIAAARKEHPLRGGKRTKKGQAVLDALSAKRDIAASEFIAAAGATPVVLVHEVLHGFSPVSPHTYRGMAGQVEEITTETAARRVAHDAFGTQIDGPTAGAYSSDIGATHAAVTELVGDGEVAWRAVQDASLRFKRRSERLLDVGSVVKAYAHDLADVAKVDRGKMEQALRKHLSAVNSAP